MTADLTRLHITPFAPALLQAVVGPNLLDLVSNLSYHSIQTSPEAGYGFLDLPTPEAQKVKKKLNGAILKGQKMKVEEARPKKRRRVEEAVEEPAKEVSRTREKRSKKEHNVVQGHELPPARKVKRGWTEPTKTKSEKKSKGKTTSMASKYSEKEELLFRTKVPPNKSDAHRTKKKEKDKSKAHVVHEFERSTTQPSFLRQDVGLGIGDNLEYVEGQGWVDGSGNVVEQESERVQRQRQAISTAATANRRKIQSSDESLPSSSSNDGGDDEATKTDVTTASPFDEAGKEDEDDDDDETSSSGSSSALDSDAEAQETVSDNDEARSVSTSTPKSSEQTTVHPLEALFKKPSKPVSQDVAKPSLEVSTEFSFFNSEEHDDVAEELAIPGTPFSSQDTRARGLRSAAPTPDTAYPSRFNSYGSSGLPGDEVLDEDGSDDDNKATPAQRSRQAKERLSETPSRAPSEFEKKFWENRGDNNRAWKSRRRTMLKEKRQRENKARRPKNW
jgi:hypothetical protein